MKSRILKERYNELNGYYLQFGALIAQVPFWIYEGVVAAWIAASALSIMTITQIIFRHIWIKEIEKLLD